MKPMNCEQKSGIFLNRSCENEAIKICSNCNKNVCKTHSHILDAKKLCEDCYWEFFLYSEEHRNTETYIDNRNNHDRTTTFSQSSNSGTTEREGFEGGFGGGQFGGAGASGVWTEGDKQGFNQEDAATAGAGLFDDGNDSTFFYS